MLLTRFLARGFDGVTRECFEIRVRWAAIGLVAAAAVVLNLSTGCASRTTHSVGTGKGGTGGTGGTAGTSGTGGMDDGACTPGERQCSGLTPLVCSEDGGWVSIGAECAEACSNGSCSECSADDTRCADGAVERCEGGAWTIAEVCEGTCEDSECVEACTEGRLQCSGTELQLCDSGEYVTEESCEFLCTDGSCAGTCVPDARRCNPEAPEESQSCDARGEWSDGVPCEGDTVCVEGECKPCQPGQRRCTQSGPEECGSDGEWARLASCGAPTPVCFDGDCVACNPGDRRCDEDELQECAADGTDWELVEVCSGETPACLQSTWSCGRCVQGETQCNGDGDTVQSCNDEGTWEDDELCSGATPVCENGSCVAEPTECGNGKREADEECDDGEPTTTCSKDCTSCEEPSPMTVLDQSVGYCTLGSFMCANGWARQNGQSIAQQFHVSQVGTLTEVELYVVNDVAADKPMLLELIDAGANANLMDGADPQELEASYVVAEAETQGTASGQQWESFDFSDQGIVLDPDSTYYLWLRMPPDPVTPSDQHIRWNLWDDESVADPYPGGRPYFCPPGTTCQVEVQTFWDYSFRVRLTPPLPLCE